MKKLSLIVAIVAILSMALSACSAFGPTPTATPSAEDTLAARGWTLWDPASGEEPHDLAVDECTHAPQPTGWFSYVWVGTKQYRAYDCVDVRQWLVSHKENAHASEAVHGMTWEIQYFKGATAEMKAWNFRDLAPAEWPEFPDVDNGDYKAAQGLEYGEDLSVFCQYSETCDVPVAARHYRIYTGDYTMTDVGSCKAEDGNGCALMLINVGEVTATFENQAFDAGFTVTGRYWDGAFLPQAIWAGLSHAANGMLNLDSDLNPTGVTNAGANCSVPGGCTSIEATFVVTSGNEILLIGRSTVSR